MKALRQSDAEHAKRKNIIGMSLGFSAMLRNFSEGSGRRIEDKLEGVFAEFSDVRTRDEFEVLHQSFCEWFVRNIPAADRRGKDGRARPGGTTSYGQAAKIMDVAAKVYVHYCWLPTPQAAKRIIPWLHGAIDTPILKHLKSSLVGGPKARSSTIKGIDSVQYVALQSTLRTESEGHGLLPVEYDDVLWRRLNRRPPESWRPAWKNIRNEELTPSDVPPGHASWEEISDFALSYYCHTQDGAVPESAWRRGEAPVEGSLDELRAWLFAMQRAVRGGGADEPGEELLGDIRAVIGQIRRRLAPR